VAAEAGAAVVTVINSRTTSSRTGAAIKELTWGSGVIVDARGYVLTNEHVVTGAQELVVSLHDGRDLFARRIAGDAAQDLALLKITRAGQYEALRWGDSARLRLGEAVIVLGSPLGNLPGSVTTGVVSGLERSVTVEDNAKMSGLIQTDAAINRGNSGGALLNVGGELMGIVTLIVRETSAGDDRHVQGVGFAAPANVARPLAEKWIAADNP
jgi:S1-C subfamily serine protease